MNTFVTECRNMRILYRNIRNTKKRLINSIMRKVRPLMWESGYCGRTYHQDRAMLKIYCFPDDKVYKLPGATSLREGIMGFTENNTVIDDAYAGGLSNIPLSSLPVEDLIILWYWVKTNRYKQFKEQ